MRRRLSEAAKERWRKRKATMQVSQNEGDHNIQRASLTSQNEVAEGPSHSALTTDNAQSKPSQSAAFTSKREVSKGNNMIVRRSNQIKSLGSFGKRQGRKAVQHIDLTDCDRDKELHVEPIRGVVHNRGKRPFARETSPTNLNYKILSTDSEKKIKALTEENYRQAQKLCYLLGKVEIYEKMLGPLMNLSRVAVKLHPDAAALNSVPALKSSPVKKKQINVKRMKKN